MGLGDIFGCHFDQRPSVSRRESAWELPAICAEENLRTSAMEGTSLKLRRDKREPGPSALGAGGFSKLRPFRKRLGFKM